MRNRKRNLKSNFISYGFIILFFIGVILIVNSMGAKPKEFTYNEFINELTAGSVVELEITPKQSASNYLLEGKYKKDGKKEEFKLKVPYTDSVVADILDVSKDNKKLDVKVNKDPESSSVFTILVNSP